jgi:NAD(P)-dependent dehydrogenase (short-subunit alcohol dehydrogenase family)
MSEAENQDQVNQEDIDKAIEVLENLLTNTNQLFEIDEQKRVALMSAAGKLSRPDKKEYQKRKKDAKKAAKRKIIERDKHARKNTGIRSAREDAVFIAPKFLEMPKTEDNDNRPELESPRNCYVCKKEFTKLHHFYDTMCGECGDFNYAKRFQTADLSGQVAVVTGSRLKIGYHITLILLRSGATVVATTRFPVDSALRFSKEEDFTEWGHRLHIHGLDLRHIPSVEIFCNFIEMKYKRLDILINNAAQTVRRPAGFYKHLMDKEEMPISELPQFAKDLLKDHHDCITELNTLAENIADEKNLPVTWHGKQPGVGLSSSAKLSQIPYSFDNSLKAEEVFPEGELDVDLQQVDLRTSNSWRLKLGEIETLEMMEVQLVNSIAPFVLCNRLSVLMRKEKTGMKHIINVSAMEGKFHRFHKISRHPHTNMAKAALNMLTHTASGEFEKDGLFINAVDTGWVTDEDPVQLAKEKVDTHDFQPPLDIVDGAARVLDPLIDGINSGKHWSGKFLKDYRPIDW